MKNIVHKNEKFAIWPHSVDFTSETIHEKGNLSYAFSLDNLNE
jgi:quinol monooxygenase YgiN